MKTALIVTITCVVTLASVGAWRWWSGRKVPDPGTPVRLDSPTCGDLTEVVSVPGTIEPKTKVSISARVSARIVDLPFREGQDVHRGDANADPQVAASVLVRLDDKDLQADLRSAESRRAAQEAQIEVAKARLLAQESTITGYKIQLADARKNLSREQNLHNSKISSDATLDETQCKVDKLQSDLENAENSLHADQKNLVVLKHTLASAEADVGRSRDNLTYTVITSPIDGVVTRVKAAVGEMAITGTMNNPGTEILQVSDLSRMLVLAEVDEASIGLLAPGQKARVRCHAYEGETFEGTVESVALVQSTNQTTRAKYYETRIALEVGSRRIPSGLSADVDIEVLRHQNVLVIPSQSVCARRVDELPAKIRDLAEVEATKTETPVVYRFVNGKAVVTPVRIGPADARFTIIRAGLQTCDKVVTGPYKVLEGLKHDQSLTDDRKASAVTSQPATALSPTSAPATLPAGTPAAAQ